MDAENCADVGEQIAMPVIKRQCGDEKDVREPRSAGAIAAGDFAIERRGWFG
jgi:hypothetical protein